VASGWPGNASDRMKVRGYCSYKVTMPPGKSFAGEKLLIDFNTDALRAMAHQADLIAIAYDIRLNERRPIDLDDRELVANNYSRYHSYLSGGTAANAERFSRKRFDDFYYGLGGPGQQGSWGLYGLGGDRQTPGPSRAPHTLSGRVLSPDTWRYYGPTMATRVIDFSNPLTIKLERERAFQW